MENEGGSRERRLTRISLAATILPFPILIICWAFGLAGCASPGEPIERKALVPTPIEDLSAEQSGNSVILTFTLPRESADHRILKQPPEIEIFRRFSGGAPASEQATSPLLVTIPSAMVEHYSEQGRVRYVDVLRPEDLSQRGKETARYFVRTRASQKKASPDSNVAGVRIYPAADPIEDLKAEVVHSVVALTWSPPEKTPVGPSPPIKVYRIYRAQMPSQGAAEKQSGAIQEEVSRVAHAGGAEPGTASTPAKITPALIKIADSETPNYNDSQEEFGRTYAYAVRSVIEYSGEEVESSDSNLVTITVRDTVPPSAPQGLLVVFVPGEGEIPAHFELSWSINPETDITGYNVYRTEEQGTLGERLNTELLPTPTFRDMSAVVGHHYFYSVTAVDRSGNESARSAVVASELPEGIQPKP